MQRLINPAGLRMEPELIEDLKNVRRIYDDDEVAVGSVGGASIALWVGIKCNTQYGMLITRIKITNLEGAGPHRYQVRLSGSDADQLTGYTLSGGGTCRLRNRGVTAEGVGYGAAISAIAKHAGTGGTGVGVVVGNQNIAQGVNYEADWDCAYFLERFNHLWVRNTTINVAHRVVFEGIEFLTEQQRDLYLALMT